MADLADLADLADWEGECGLAGRGGGPEGALVRRRLQKTGIKAA